MMAPGHLDAVRAIVRAGRLRQGQPDPRGRPSTRNDTTRARSPRSATTTATCCFTTPSARCVEPTHHRRVLRRARRRTRPSTSRSRRPTRSSRSTTDDDDHATIPPRATCCAAARPRRRSGSRPSGRPTRRPPQDPDFEATDDCTVVLRYLPDVPIAVVRGRRAQHEGHRADRRLHRRQAVPARPAADRPRTRWPRTSTARASTARRSSSSAAATASARTSPTSRQAYGADGVHVQPLHHQHPRRAPRGHRRRPAARCSPSTGRIDFVVNTAGVLPRGALAETTEETIYAATEVNYLAPIFIAQEFYPHLARDAGLAAAVHLELLHPRPHRLQPLLLGQGRDGQPHPGAGRRVGRRPASGSTASTPSAPAPRCAPRRSARSRPARCSTRGGGPRVAGRAALRADRSRHRRPQARPDGGVLGQQVADW